MALILTPRSVSGASSLPGPLKLDSGSAVIGRAGDADLCLPNPLVSSRHCAVAGQGAAWQLQDTSTNGTLVNGQRVSGSRTLSHGDVIGIADVELVVAIDGAAQPAARTPPPRLELGDWGRPSVAGSTTAQPLPPAPVSPAGTMRQPAGSSGAATGGDQQNAAAGAAFRAAITGLSQLAQARRQARRDLKVPGDVEPDNPILSGSPEAALSRLAAMAPAAAAGAVAAACRELDAHQRASLAAMQAAFRAALDQFAPDAIKLRARDDAAAWKSYEKAFSASDGFVEMFAQEFAKAYESLTDSRRDR